MNAKHTYFTFKQFVLFFLYMRGCIILFYFSLHVLFWQKENVCCLIMQLAGASQRASGLHWRSTCLFQVVWRSSFCFTAQVCWIEWNDNNKKELLTAVINAEPPQIRRPLRVYLQTHLAHVELIKTETTKRARLHLANYR